MVKDELSADEVRALRTELRDHISKTYAQFALLEQFLADGRVRKVRGGYQIDASVYPLISLLVQGATIPRDSSKATFKLMKRTKRFDSTARKVGVDVPGQ